MVVAQCRNVLLPRTAMSTLLPRPQELIIQTAAGETSSHQLFSQAQPRTILLAARKSFSPGGIDHTSTH